MPRKPFFPNIFLCSSTVSVGDHSVKRQHPFIVTQELCLSWRVCHEAHGGYPETDCDGALNEENPRPAFGTNQLEHQGNSMQTCHCNRHALF